MTTVTIVPMRPRHLDALMHHEHAM
ncbi:MAG: hypothetical protein QOJ37_3568, partial [Pseudonocardiales bacterium]|nr:hypothetical protein [Pseudonocardiales bacterium]